MAADSPAPVLELDALRIEFPTRHGTLVAVDGVSLSIAPGEILGVVGESGAGKSLTGNAVIGTYTRGGTVVTVGSTDWSHGLRGNDPAVVRVTRNVLDRLRS